MKNIKQNFNLDDVLRILGGILIILEGIAVIVIHLAKVVPTGWETSKILGAIALIWAYTGPFIGFGIIIFGIYIMDVFDDIVKWIEKKGWLN